MSEETSISATPCSSACSKALPREAGVGEPADRALDDAGAVVGRVEHAGGVAVGRARRRCPRRAAASAGSPGRCPSSPLALLACGDRLLGAAGAVAVGAAAARGVEGVVVVVEEVPAGDVVDEAVAVGVVAVGEGGDQIGGVEDRRRTRCRRRCCRRAGRRRSRGRRRQPSPLQSSGGAGGAARPAAGCGSSAALRWTLLTQLPVLPANPGVEDRDDVVSGSPVEYFQAVSARTPRDLGALGIAGGDVGGPALGVELVAVDVLWSRRRSSAATAGTRLAESGLKPNAPYCSSK